MRGGARGGAGERRRRRSAPRRRRSRPRAAARRRPRRDVSPVERAASAASGREPRRRPAPARAAPSASASASSAPARRPRAAGEHVHLAAVGHEAARLAGVGEERHRRLRADQRRGGASPASCADGHLGQVRRAARTRARRRRAPARLGNVSRTAARRWRRRSAPAARRPAPARGGAAEQQRGRLARAQRLRGGLDGPVAGPRAARATGSAAAGPRARSHDDVGGQDQRGDPAGVAARPRPRPRRRRSRRQRASRVRRAPSATRCRAIVSMSLASGASSGLW